MSNKKEKIFDICLILGFIGIFCTSNIFIKTISDLDELWNYNFANNISKGLIPYNDFNIITFCPVFVKFMHTISSFITIITKQENCTPHRCTVFLTYYMEFCKLCGFYFYMECFNYYRHPCLIHFLYS